MSPFLKGSVALHGAAAAGALLPGVWPYSLGAVVANHALITGAGLWPRSNWLGENLTRLPDTPANSEAMALTLDDGPDPEVTPRVLDLLDAEHAKVTFFCIGERVRAHPAIARDIIARGHTLENHSARHRHNFSFSTPAAFRRELSDAQAMIADVTGYVPRFFRAPAGLRNPFLDPVLQALGLRLVSWTRRGFDTRERDPNRVLRRLTTNLQARDILLLHDGHSARSAQGEPVCLEVLAPLLKAISQARLTARTLRDAIPESKPPQ